MSIKIKFKNIHEICLFTPRQERGTWSEAFDQEWCRDFFVLGCVSNKIANRSTSGSNNADRLIRVRRRVSLLTIGFLSRTLATRRSQSQHLLITIYISCLTYMQNHFHPAIVYRNLCLLVPVVRFGIISFSYDLADLCPDMEYSNRARSTSWHLSFNLTWHHFHHFIITCSDSFLHFLTWNIRIEPEAPHDTWHLI